MNIRKLEKLERVIKSKHKLKQKQRINRNKEKRNLQYKKYPDTNGENLVEF